MSISPFAGEGLLVLFLLFVYFIPTIVAGRRQHANANAIAVLNIFLGWTFIGWVAALIWAFTNNPSPAR